MPAPTTFNLGRLVSIDLAWISFLKCCHFNVKPTALLNLYDRFW